MQKRILKKKISKTRARKAEKFPAGISEGDEYDLEISGQKKGKGFALVKNFVVLIPNAKRGDFVHVKILEVKKDHALARVMSSEEPMSLGKNLKEQYEEAEEMAAAGVIQPPEEED